MAKPILIIKLPSSYSQENMNVVINQINSNEELTNDYHIFTIPNNDDNYRFKVFNGEYSEEEFYRIQLFIDDLNK